MIDKQNELLGEIRDLLGNELKYRDLLLDKFFGSLLPIGVKATIHPHVLKKLFLMLVESVETTLMDPSGYHFVGMKDPEYVYVIVKEERSCMKEQCLQVLANNGIPTSKIIQSHILEQEISYSCYIYNCDDRYSQNKFLQILQSLIDEVYAAPGWVK
jgi:hypothetical protein